MKNITVTQTQIVNGAKQVKAYEQAPGAQVIQMPVQPHSAVGIAVDGKPLNPKTAGPQSAVKLRKAGKHLEVLDADGQTLVELQDFYATEDVVLEGQGWEFATGQGLTQAAQGVTATPEALTAASAAPSLASAASVGLGGNGALMGGAALALAAAGGGGGGGGGGNSGGGAGSGGTAAVNNALNGLVMLGPVQASSGLTVHAYDASGKWMGSGAVGADGRYSINLDSYKGAVLVLVQDKDGNADYLDEATGKPMDVSAQMSAISVTAAGTNTLNINPLTTLAARKAGAPATAPTTFNDNQQGVSLGEQNVQAANEAIRVAFKLAQAITQTDPDAVNDGSTPDVTASNVLGKLLAAISGLDLLNGGDQEQTLQALADKAAAGDLNALAQELVKGAQAAQANGALPGLVAGVSDALQLISASGYSIGTVAGDDVIGQSEVGSNITLSGALPSGVTTGLKISLNGADGIGQVTVNASAKTWSYTLTANEIAALGADGPKTIKLLSGGAEVASRVIYLDAVDDPPTAVTLVNTTTSLLETANISGGKKLADIVMADPDGYKGDPPTVSDAAHFEVRLFDGKYELWLKATTSLDYESVAGHIYTTTVSAGGKASETYTLAIADVNEAPTGADKTFTIDEDSSLALAAADFGFKDAAGEAGALAGVIITTLPMAGTLKLNGVAVTVGQTIAAADLSKLVYAPAKDANGTAYATIGFKVQDNGGTANGGVDTSTQANTLTINVSAVNDAPVNTVPTAKSVSPDTNLALAGLSVADVDAGSGTLTVSLSVLNGTITVAAASGVTLTGNGSASVQLSGTLTAINAALAASNGVIYRPTLGYQGDDTLTMLTNDGGNAGSGGAKTDSKTVAITVAIDTVPPDAPSVVGLQADTGSSASDYVTRNGTLLLSGLEVGAFLDVSTDGGSTWSRANGGAANTATTGSIVLGPGSYSTVLVRQVDAAGNVGQSTSWGSSFVLQSAHGTAGAYADSTAQATRLSDGGYVLAWQGATNDGQGDDIFVQRYNASNAAVGDALRFKGSGGAYNDRNVQITALAGGSYALAWSGGTSDGQGTDIFVQVVNSSNVAQGSPQRLRYASGAYIDDQAQITALSDGGFAVAWRGYKSDLSVDYDIAVQRFDASGQAVGNRQVLGQQGVWDDDQTPQITALSGGGYVVVWDGYSQDTGYNVFAQTFNGSGAKVGVQLAWVTAGFSLTTPLVVPQVAALTGGGYVVAWQNAPNSGQPDIYLQQVDANNQKVGSLLQLQGMSGNLDDTAPQLAALNDGGYVVAWQGATSDGQGTDIFVQQYGSSGTAVGSMQRLKGQSGNLADTAPQVTALTGGGYVVVWQGATSDGAGADIFAQQYSSSGSAVGSIHHLQGQGGNAADTAPQVAALADGGYVVTWQGDASGQSTDIFSQRFDAQGHTARTLTVDTAGPVFQSASIVGDTLTLSYSDAPDANALPDPSQFTVALGGVNTAVSAIRASGNTLVLTLQGAAGYQQAVTLAYTDPTAGDDARAVQDLAGNDAASLSGGVAVSNSTAFAPPVLKLQADTGSSDSDGITSNGTVLVSGLAAGASWQYSTDGGNSWLTGSGSSFALSASSTAYDVRVKQTQGSNTSNASAAWQVTVDQTAPTTATLAGFDKTGSVGSSGTLTDIVGTGMTHTAGGDSALLEGTSEAYASVTFSIGGQSKTATADSNGYWSYRLTDTDFANVGYGAETITITSITDRAGNSASTQITRNVTFNAVADTTSHAESGYGSDYIDALVWGGAGWKGSTITYSFAPGSGSAAWTASEKASFAVACQSYANVCNLRFVEGSYNADADLATSIVLNKVPGSTWTESSVLADFEVPVDGLNSTHGAFQGRFDYGETTWNNLTPGSLGFYTIIHELGHGLGLSHPFDGTPKFPGVTSTYDLGINSLNQGIWTVMSYTFDWSVSQADTANNWGMPKAPMGFDIAAMQTLYGANTSYKTGNDTYTLPTTEANGTGWECIWDAGGNDTISNAGSNLACTINLNAYPKAGGVASEPYVSYVSGGSIAGGFTIADGATIENAIGGNGNDTLTGNAVANTLTGNGGADRFVFNTALGASNIDTITDFTVGTDKLGLSKAIFSAFANATSVASDQVRSGAGITTAADANDYLIYNTSTGALYYDADGSGSTASVVQFAWLQNKPASIDASAFVVI